MYMLGNVVFLGMKTKHCLPVLQFQYRNIILYIFYIYFMFDRLKDVFTAMKNGNELRLMLVFEYVEQDLAQYLERCPSPGLGPDRIRVGL